ncbi:MAG TPA: nicotinate-nucleotide adenylyltransferase [Candidatus Dormibacteraeota bacterium]|nr:nicotinate-nucleotide adenylyltransferase [Candidatus Dormibacteraeota bacterium]
MKIGVVGGTFDPVHVGHVAMAEAAIACAGLDLVVLVPAGLPPHRRPTVAPAEDRLRMCQLAVAGRPRFMVSDLEVRRPGPSYTADTLRQLAERWPGEELYLVLGWDAAREVRTWHRPEEVLRLARLVVVTRPGHRAPTPEDLARVGIDPERTILCDVRTPDVESTDIRRLAEHGGSLTGLVHPAVEAYLRRHRLYAHPPGSGVAGPPDGGRIGRAQRGHNPGC